MTFRARASALIAATLAALAIGCGEEDAEPAADEPTESVSSSTPAEPDSSSATPDPEPTTEVTTGEPELTTAPTFSLGRTFEALEVKVTVTKVEAVDLGNRGNPGLRETVEAYVKTCTPQSATEPWTVSTFDFVAITKSARVIAPDALLSGVREPTYPTFGDLRPGRCREGWVQVGMDAGDAKTVKLIEFQPGGTPAAAWRLPRQLTLGQPDY